MPTLAREIVLRHEITHVAQDALPRDNVPTWLTEGMADYVGYRGSGVPDSLVGAQLFAQVRASRCAGRPARRSRSSTSTDPARSDASAYQAGWAFCQMLVDEYGEDAAGAVLRRRCREVRGRPSERLDDAADEVLGTSFDDLRAPVAVVAGGQRMTPRVAALWV